MLKKRKVRSLPMTSWSRLPRCKQYIHLFQCLNYVYVLTISVQK